VILEHLLGQTRQRPEPGVVYGMIHFDLARLVKVRVLDPAEVADTT
jgi:hypothetical protein